MRAPTLLLFTLACMAATALAPPAGAQEGESFWMLHIYQYQYAPDPMEVPPGETVTVMNFEPPGPDSAHTVTSVDGLFDVQQIQTGGIPYNFTAPTTPGEYRYYCRYHGDASGSGMAGTLVVTESAGSSGEPTPAAGSPTPAPTGEAEERSTPLSAAFVVLAAIAAMALTHRRAR